MTIVWRIGAKIELVCLPLTACNICKGKMNNFHCYCEEVIECSGWQKAGGLLMLLALPRPL